MGMFDTVYLKQIFCPLCGHRLSDAEYQTKSAECHLNTYQSREEFESAHPELKSYEIHNFCPACGEWHGIVIPNKSAECRTHTMETLKVIRTETEERETKAHPNHEYRPDRSLPNTHCCKCKEMGVKSGDLPPDAAPELIKQQLEIRANAPRKQKEFLDKWAHFDGW